MGLVITLILLVATAVLGMLVPTLVLAQDDFSLMIVTDVGGINDQTFNQGAWEGAQAWAEEQGNPDAVSYLRSRDDGDYVKNLSFATQSGVGFGVWYWVSDAAIIRGSG